MLSGGSQVRTCALVRDDVRAEVVDGTDGRRAEDETDVSRVGGFIEDISDGFWGDPDNAAL